MERATALEPGRGFSRHGPRALFEFPYRISPVRSQPGLFLSLFLSFLLFPFARKEQSGTEKRRTERSGMEEERREQRRAEQNRTEQNRAEQNRTEQNRTEQNRTEQNRTEQSRTEQSRTEQNRTEQNRTPKQNRAEQNTKTEQNRTPKQNTPIKINKKGNCRRDSPDAYDHVALLLSKAKRENTQEHHSAWMGLDPAWTVLRPRARPGGKKKASKTEKRERINSWCKKGGLGRWMDGLLDG